MGELAAARKPGPFALLPNHEKADFYRHVPMCTVHWKPSVLSTVFTQWFVNFDAHKCRFELLSNPFAVVVENAPTNFQMELIQLQCCNTLRSKYDAVVAAQFPHFIPDTKAQLCIQAAQMLFMFSGTYLCVQLFSLMKMTKTSHRRHPTDEHLYEILRISSTHSPSQDIDWISIQK